MTSTQIAVTVGGLAAIAWVNWYFFIASHRAVAAADPAGGLPQRVRIEVRGGYAPADIRVRAGRPVRMEFVRTETNPCTDEVVLPDFGIRTYLPPGKLTPITITPAAGSYRFSCGMGMVHGRIVAEEA